MVKYLQNFEFMFQSGSNFGNADVSRKILKISLFVYGLIDRLSSSNHDKFQILLFSTVLESNEIIHKKSRHFSPFL